MTGPGARKSPAARCPICARPPAPEFRPFCSARCADVDLALWLGEGYGIPVADDEERPSGEARQGAPGED